jgi:hypothetical protein
MSRSRLSAKAVSGPVDAGEISMHGEPRRLEWVAQATNLTIGKLSLYQPIQPNLGRNRPPRPLGQQLAPGSCHAVEMQRGERGQTSRPGEVRDGAPSLRRCVSSAVATNSGLCSTCREEGSRHSLAASRAELPDDRDLALERLRRHGTTPRTDQQRSRYPINDLAGCVPLPYDVDRRPGDLLLNDEPAIPVSSSPARKVLATAARHHRSGSGEMAGSSGRKAGSVTPPSPTVGNRALIRATASPIDQGGSVGTR